MRDFGEEENCTKKESRASSSADEKGSAKRSGSRVRARSASTSQSEPTTFQELPREHGGETLLGARDRVDTGPRRAGHDA